MRKNDIKLDNYVNRIKDDIEDPIDEYDFYYYDDFKDHFREHIRSLFFKIIKDFFNEKSFNVDNIHLEIKENENEYDIDTVYFIFNFEGEEKKINISNFYYSLGKEDGTLAWGTYTDGAEYFEYNQMGADQHESNFYEAISIMINTILVDYCDIHPLSFDDVFDWYESQLKKNGSKYSLHYLD